MSSHTMQLYINNEDKRRDLNNLLNAWFSLGKHPTQKYIEDWYAHYCNAAFKGYEILNGCLLALDDKKRHLFVQDETDYEVLNCLIWSINTEILIRKYPQNPFLF